MPINGKLTEEESPDYEALFELAEEQVHNDTGVLESRDLAFLFGDEESRTKGFKPLKEKFDKFGVGMFISDKQHSWAMSLLDKLKAAAEKNAPVESANAKKF